MNKRFIFSALGILIMFSTLAYLQFKPPTATTALKAEEVEIYED